MVSQFMRIALGLAVSLAAAACAPPAQDVSPDLVITNARVFTADPQQPWAEAVAIRDGRIAAVGSSADISALTGEATRTIDAGGRLLVPGLTDAHMHLGQYGSSCQPLPPINLPYPGPTPTELLDAVKTAAASGDGWVCGTMGPLVVEDTRNWRAALDAVAPGRPVVVSASWGHPSLFNSAAMQALGITDATPNPAGGSYDRDPSGKLTGVARESAETLIYRAITKDIDAASLAHAIDAMAQRYLSWGVTDVHLMASGMPLEGTLTALAATKAPLTWAVYGWGYPAAPLDTIWTEVEAAKPPANVRLAGVKWILDGTPIERGALMRDDYDDKPGWRGVSNFSDSDLDIILTNALAGSGQTALHVVGDGELARLLAAMEAKAPPAQWIAKRIRIEHGDGLAPDLRDRAKALGLAIIQNPLHFDPSPMNPSAAAPTGTRYDAERASTLFPLKSLISSGIPLAIGSDAGGDGANPWLNLMLATFHPMNPPEALTREQALAAYTAGGAYAEGKEADRGMIRAGMQADLALLSQDVLAVPPPELPKTRSLLTIVDGKIAHEEPLAAPPA
jgi:predicted amidohydrolase YtcJ